MDCGYFYHGLFAQHDMGQGHPESPQRVVAVHQALHDAGLLARLKTIAFTSASDAQLLRVHQASYLEQLTAASPLKGMVALDADTSMNPYSLSSARLASGAAVAAVQGIASGQFKRAFCNVRPPGHHAQTDRAMGFCFFNHIAVAAMHAQTLGFERVAVIDWDVHHGNGTEQALAGRANCLMLGSFQHPFYPGSGRVALADNIFNAPLPAGSSGDSIRCIVEQHWWPRLNQFKPQLILLSAGFDAHTDDTMSGLHWTDQDYLWLSQQVVDMANQHCQGRMVSLLEGGYDLASLQRCTTIHIEQLLTPIFD